MLRHPLLRRSPRVALPIAWLEACLAPRSRGLPALVCAAPAAFRGFFSRCWFFTTTAATAVPRLRSPSGHTVPARRRLAAAYRCPPDGPPPAFLLGRSSCLPPSRPAQHCRCCRRRRAAATVAPHPAWAARSPQHFALLRRAYLYAEGSSAAGTLRVFRPLPGRGHKHSDSV